MPSIAAGAAAIVKFKVVVDNPLAAGATIVNQATVDGHIPSCADTTAPCEPTTIDTVNLLAIKTVVDADGDGRAEQGEVLTYTLTISNTGSGTATNIPVTDPVTDTDVTYLAGSTAVNGTTGGDIRTGVTITSIAPGAAATVTFQVTVDNPLAAGAIIINRATVDGHIPSCDDLTSCGPTKIKTVNLVMIKTVVDANGDNVADPGELLTYTLTISNTGSGTASNIAVTDPVTDTDVTYRAGSTTLNGAAAGDITSGITIPSLTSGAAAIVQFQVQLAASLPPNVQVVNRATADGHIPSCDDLVTCGPTIFPTVTFIVVKTVADADGDGVAEPGEVLTYTITISNTGSGTATNVAVTDPVTDTDVTYVAGSTAVNGTTGGDIRTGVTVASIASGSAARVTFRVKVDDPLAPGATIINQATINGHIPSCADTTAPCEPTTIKTVNLVAIKTVVDADGDGAAAPGEQLTYTLTVTNTGTATAINIAITDPISDPNVTYLLGSTTLGGTRVGDITGGITVPSIEPGVAVVIRFKVTVKSQLAPGTTIVNQARVDRHIPSCADSVAPCEPTTIRTVLFVLGNLIWEDMNNNGVVDVGEPGLANAPVVLFLDANGNGRAEASEQIATTTTDSLGIYTFTGLSSGEYIVALPTSAFAAGAVLEGYVTSTGTNGRAIGRFEPAPDPDNQVNNDDNGMTQTVSCVAAGVGCANGMLVVSKPVTLGYGRQPGGGLQNLTLDMGLFRTDTLGSFVWFDTNQNGIYDPGEPPAPGVIVTLYDQNGNIVRDPDGQPITVPTDVNGEFRMIDLIPGSYQLGFSGYPSQYSMTAANQGSDDMLDSDVDPSTGLTPVLTLRAGEINLSLGAGLINAPAAVTLSEFSAIWQGAQVDIRWVTTAELDTFGFYLERSATGDRSNAERITPQLIVARGRGQGGASYTWADTTAILGTRYLYWLVEVETSGTELIYGPATATLQIVDDRQKVFLPISVR